MFASKPPTCTGRTLDLSRKDSDIRYLHHLGNSDIAASFTIRPLPLAELLVDTKTELFELMVGSGLRVVDALLEEDRTALCGPRDVRQAARNASRAGTVLSEVVLGGLKVTHGTAARARRLWDQRFALTAT